MKVCRNCGVERAVDDFIKGSSYADGRQPWCSDCRRAYRAGRRDHQRELERASRYGISPEDQRALLAAQGGLCPGCETAITAASSHLDHDHATDEIRGFLCGPCNQWLGVAGDSVDYLRAAAEDHLQRAHRAGGLADYLTSHAAILPSYVTHDGQGSTCVNGHEWTDEMTYRGPSGSRHCIPCRRGSDRRRKPKSVAL